jgi:hypothetical protein
MGRETKYFALSMESLRAIGSWAADCAERALSVYEGHADTDSRPRAAIEGIRVFAGGEKRTARLRVLALAAFAAAHTHIRWWMSNKQSTLSVQRPMPHWPLNSSTLATQTSVMARSTGRLSTRLLKCARSYSRCLLVNRERAGWTCFFMHWMRAFAVDKRSVWAIITERC